MQHAPQVREHSMHRGRRNQNKRRRDERCVNCQWFGIPTKRRGWKVNLRQNLDEKNEQQHAQQKNKTAAPLSHHKRSLAEASTQCQWDRGLRHVRAIRGSSLYFRWRDQGKSEVQFFHVDADGSKIENTVVNCSQLLLAPRFTKSQKC